MAVKTKELTEAKLYEYRSLLESVYQIQMPPDAAEVVQTVKHNIDAAILTIDGSPTYTVDMDDSIYIALMAQDTISAAELDYYAPLWEE